MLKYLKAQAVESTVKLETLEGRNPSCEGGEALAQLRAAPSLEASKAGQGLEQPGIVEVSLPMAALRSLPTQTIPCFCDCLLGSFGNQEWKYFEFFRV